MRLLPKIITTIFLALLVAAGCAKPHPESAAREYEDGLTMQAWMMLDTGAPFHDYFAVQEEAVRQLREGTSRENPVAVLEQMAYFLFSAGRLEEALPYFDEALDSLHAQPGTSATESAVQLYGDLSQYYDRLGMADKAIEYSDSSLAVSRRCGGQLMSDIWRFRTQIYANRGRTAEAFTCLDSAADAVRRSPDTPDSSILLAGIDAERANIILSLHPSRDSVDLAVALLEKIRREGVEHYFTEYEGAYGQALYLQGHKKEGIALMESALARIRGFGDLELTFLEMRRLIEVYSAEHMYDKVSHLYTEYTELSDSMSRARHNLDLVTAKVRADVAAKERENHTLQRQLASKQRQNVLIICVFLLFAATAVGLIVVGRRYYLRMKRRRDAEHARRLSAEVTASEAISERDSALERIDALRTEMSTVPSDILHRPQPFGDNTGPFLRAFNAMYPSFADSLRGDYPSLTDTDMTFCMLIYLHHSTEEISVYLNISRASVNSARYRIRTKLALPKDINLDQFLQQRPG